MIMIAFGSFQRICKKRLDAFLDLKMENERSQQRLMWLRANDSATPAGLPLHYAASSMHHPPRATQPPPSDIYSRSGWGIHGEPLSSPTRNTFDDGYASDVYPPASISQGMDDEASEDGSKKLKKVIKKVLLYVQSTPSFLSV
jgi:hypothetical protein